MTDHQHTWKPVTADEMIELVVTGDHPETSHGSLLVDAILIQALREGVLEAARCDCGVIGFQKTEFGAILYPTEQEET